MIESNFVRKILKKTANAAAAAALDNPKRIPRRYCVSKWKIKETPSTVRSEKRSSFARKRERVRSGSRIAVKNPMVENVTTPIETFDALIEA